MPFLRRPGIGLYYEEDGEGSPPLLFVHGYTCSHEDGRLQIAHLRAGHRVVTCDLPGHFNMLKAPDQVNAAIADFVATVDKA